MTKYFAKQQMVEAIRISADDATKADLAQFVGYKRFNVKANVGRYVVRDNGGLYSLWDEKEFHSKFGKLSE